MKRTVFTTLMFCVIPLLAVSASATQTKAFSPKDFKARITNVYPGNGMHPRMDQTYYMTIRDGKINTFLPFIGTDENPVYGGDPSIDVNSEMEEYIEKTKKNGKEIEIKFKCTDSNHLVWEVSLTIFEGETINAHFRTNSRSPMNFGGDIEDAPEDAME